MIHSRAYLLLEREFKEYETANLFGIYITPVEDSLMEWIGEIKGLKDSLWEGAELQLSLKYTDHYNAVPPSINFTTIPFHPNVDPRSGRPCLDFLDDLTKWNPNLTMLSILLSIQVLLSNPVLTNAVNLEAAKMVLNNFAMYRQKVMQCVKASQHIEDIPGAFSPPIKYFHRPEEPADVMRMITTISYEDYYMTWTKMATSKAAEHFGTSVFDDPDFIGNSYDWLATNIDKDEWPQNMYNFVSVFIEKQKKLKLLRLERLLLRTPRPTPVSLSRVPTGKLLEHQKKRPDQEEEPWEKEVEELVLWSTNLDETSWD